MRIDLFKDYNRSSAIEIVAKIRDLDIDIDEFSFDDDIHVICSMQKDMGLARIEGEVDASPVLECSRCLKSFRQDIVGNFSIIARQLKKGETIPVYSDDDRNEDEDDLIYVAHDEDSIDITKFVHDALLLSIPLKPVCSEDCKGLCPVCGNNLNESECGCNRESNDPRWQALSGILSDSADEKK